jgi:hypothetical protein
VTARAIRGGAGQNPGLAVAVLGATVGLVVLVQVGGPPVMLALAGALAFGLTVAGFLRIPHVLAAALVVFLVAQPTLRYFVSPEFGPAKDALVAAACVAAVIHRLVPGRRRGPMDAWLAAGVLVLLVLYAVNPAGPHGDAWFHGARLVIEAFGLFLAAQALPQPERTWRWTVGALIAACAATALYGLAQQGLGYVRLVEDWGYTYGIQVRETASGQLRSFGTLEDPFSYALVLGLGLAAVAVAWRSGWVALCGAIMLLGITASFVRTAVALVAGVLLVGLVRVRRTAVALGVATALMLGALTVLVAVPQASPVPGGGAADFVLTLNGRTLAWTSLMPSTGSWIVGRGVGDVGSGASRATADSETLAGRAAPILTTEEFKRRNVDSSYFATIADVGLLGLAVLLGVIGRTAVLAVRAARHGSRPGWLAIGAGVVVLLDSATRSSLTSMPAGYIALWVIGISLAAAQSERLRARAASPPVHHAPISASRR